MTSPRRDPRNRLRSFRRPPAVHRPVLPAPETPEEVLERAPTDVSRETWAELEAALEGPELAAVDELLPSGRYVAGGLPPGLEAKLEAHTAEAFQPGWEDRARASLDAAVAAQGPPPLRKDQVARLEALTAVWERKVRLEGPPDATMLYTGASRPPVPPARRTPPPSPPPAEEAPPAGPPARVSDWASRHDPASLAYGVRDRLRVAAPLRDVLLEHGPILDQGTTPPLTLREASACTGMAAAAAVNVLYLGLARGDSRAGYGPRREEEARQVYELAQDLDDRAGHDYAGTSVLAAMKAGQKLGWWASYLWALGGTRDVAQALLQLQAPVVLGLPWPAGMESPDAAGIVRPTGDAGMGHALTVVGLVRQLSAHQLEAADRPQAGVHFVLQQSRGTAEGVGGLVYLHHRDLAQLLAGSGEAAVPLPA